MTRSISHSKTATAVLLLAAVGWFGLLSAPESPVGLFETLQENISSGTRNVSLYLRSKNAHDVENNNLVSSQSSLITDSLHYSNSKRRRLTSQEEEDKFVLSKELMYNQELVKEMGEYLELRWKGQLFHEEPKSRAQKSGS